MSTQMTYQSPYCQHLLPPTFHLAFQYHIHSLLYKHFNNIIYTFTVIYLIITNLTSTIICLTNTFTSNYNHFCLLLWVGTFSSLQESSWPCLMSDQLIRGGGWIQWSYKLILLVLSYIAFYTSELTMELSLENKFVRYNWQKQKNHTTSKCHEAKPYARSQSL